MSKRLLKLIVVFLVLCVGYQSVQAQEASDLLNRTNSLRASLGLPPYSTNGALSAAAQNQAQWMLDTNSFVHTRPDGSGVRSRTATAGYSSNYVGENIYGGGMADVNYAWNFWINSGVHYAGLVNRSYSEVGIGIARNSQGVTYVMVFGNPAGYIAAPAPAGGQSNGGSGTSGGGQVALVDPPSYMGVDANGNIQHMVQSGDTVGDIALIYGYTWADLPHMLELNALDNVRDLQPGTVFLVPPRAALAVAVSAPDAQIEAPPVAETTPLPTEPPTGIPPTITPYQLPTQEASPLPPEIVELTVVYTPPAPQEAIIDSATPTLPVQIVANVMIPTPVSTPDAIIIAAAPTAAEAASVVVPQNATDTTTDNGRSNAPATWLIIALGAQVLIVAGAGFEFLRRLARRK